MSSSFTNSLSGLLLLGSRLLPVLARFAIVGSRYSTVVVEKDERKQAVIISHSFPANKPHSVHIVAANPRDPTWYDITYLPVKSGGKEGAAPTSHPGVWTYPLFLITGDRFTA
jgi:hypothetical protein